MGLTVSVPTTAAIGRLADLTTVTKSSIVGAINELVARIHPGSVIWTSGTTRPTNDPTVMVIFTGADPGTNAVEGVDFWLS